MIILDIPVFKFVQDMKPYKRLKEYKCPACSEKLANDLEELDRRRKDDKN